MNDTLLQVLRCPLHPQAGPLETVAGGGEKLRCRKCGRQFPLVQGVADMLVDADHDEAFREREIRQWDEQAARYDGERQRDPVYMAGVDAAGEALGPQGGELILDAACGTGLPLRRYLRPGLRVVALDLSLESLFYLKKVCPHPNLALVRGDLTALPFAAGVFDRVLCANALQHLPQEGLRRESVRELARVAAPGARVVVTANNYSRPRRRAGWRKEGPAKGPSGSVQYVYRHDPPEFQGLLASALRVDGVYGAGLPLPYRFKLSWLSRRLERVLRRFRASADWGNLVVGVARKS
jgi:SAM-dependent methyltransferase